MLTDDFDFIVFIVIVAAMIRTNKSVMGTAQNMALLYCGSSLGSRDTRGRSKNTCRDKVRTIALISCPVTSNKVNMV